MSRRSRVRTAWTALVVLAFGATTANAHADPSEAQVRAAEDEFQQANALVAKGRMRDACPLFLASYDHDPSGGTLQNLASCYEEVGKVASAYTRFQELLSVSMLQTPPRRDRAELAMQHIRALEARLSRIAFTFDESARPEGLRVLVDEVSYPEASLAAGVLADVGTRHVKMLAPGFVAYTTQVRVEAEGATMKVALPALKPAPVAKAPVARPDDGLRNLAELERLASERAARTTGFVIGGIGAATTLVGLGFGVAALTTQAAARGRCEGASPDTDGLGNCYRDADGTPRGALAESRALTARSGTFANVANVLVPVGLVGAGIGVWLLVRTPSHDRAATKIAARLRLLPTGAELGGTF